VTRCHCRFDGPLLTQEHRDHHRRWEASQTVPVPVTMETTHIEVTELLVWRDQMIAWAYGGPRPELTAGAQALLARQAQENRT
jgi:hypothetical protein